MIKFDGFLKVYLEGNDNEDEEQEESKLPETPDEDGEIVPKELLEKDHKMPTQLEKLREIIAADEKMEK